MGEIFCSPPIPIQDGLKVSGASNGQLQYDIVNKENLTGDKYSISFAIDSTSTEYKTTWNLLNETTGFIYPCFKQVLIWLNRDN